MPFCSGDPPAQVHQIGRHTVTVSQAVKGKDRPIADGMMVPPPHLHDMVPPYNCPPAGHPQEWMNTSSNTATISRQPATRFVATGCGYLLVCGHQEG